jgi:hypothetical protein
MPTLFNSLVAAGAALAALFFYLRFFDWLAKRGRHHFYRKNGPFDRINSNAAAAAHYYGLRFVGGSIVVGLVVGAVRLTL